jgi:hypothetical protein
VLKKVHIKPGQDGCKKIINTKISRKRMKEESGQKGSKIGSYKIQRKRKGMAKVR